MKEKILVVDDEESIRFTFKDFLLSEGYEVETAVNFSEAKEKLSVGSYDLVFADILLGGKTGIDLLGYVREVSPRTPVVMVTGAPDMKTAMEAVRLGAFDYISKPVRQDMLLRVARLALEHRRLIEEKETYRANLDAIFKGVQDGILSIDREFNLMEMNGAMERLCGYSKEALAGEGPACLDIIFKGRRPGELKEVFEKGASVVIDNLAVSGKKKTGTTVTLTASPLLDGEGAVAGAVLVFRDVTRINELERNLGERKQLRNIIGESGLMQELFSLIEVLSSVDSTVLITGESGTGKELAAEAIHYLGERSDGPLVKVNCAALPETLLESELFGHVKGAFTGAIKDTAGRFEIADGGTLFLDEIGEMTLRMQVRLLRVLQEMEFERVGSSKPIRVDVRVLAATNCDLLKKVKEGAFREDLYYRLKVVDLNFPPLRDRREDIMPLTEHFIEFFNESFSRRIVGLSNEAKEAILSYHWPGNVRELKHAVEHAFVHCRGEQITKDHLPRELFEESFFEDEESNKSTDVNRAKILEALKRALGNRTKAARLLGISRRTLYRKISLFNID